MKIYDRELITSEIIYHHEKDCLAMAFVVVSVDKGQVVDKWGTNPVYYRNEKEFDDFFNDYSRHVISVDYEIKNIEQKLNDAKERAINALKENRFRLYTLYWEE